MDSFMLERLLGQLRKLIASGKDDNILILENNGNKWFLFLDVQEIMFSIVGHRLNVKRNAPMGFEEFLRGLAQREGYTLHLVERFRKGDATPLDENRVSWRAIDDSMLFEGLRLVDKEKIEIPRITFTYSEGIGMTDMPF